MGKILDRMKCNPLACLSIFFVINSLLFGWIKSDVVEIRKDLTALRAENNQFLLDIIKSHTLTKNISALKTYNLEG